MPLHPILAALAEQEKEQGAPEISAVTPASIRNWLIDLRAQMGSGPAVGPIKPLTIPTRDGSIPARLYRPLAESLGLIVHLHGGGWVAGALDDFDTLARHLVDRSDCAVLMVDYRLAPEAPFPAALNDCEDAVRWASDHLSELAGRSVPFVVMGESAGGNLAAVVCNTLKNKVPIALQVLNYPVTDCNFDTDSYIRNAEGPILTRDAMKWFFGQYAPEELWIDERVSPLRADLRGVPPTFIATAEYDVLRNDGEAYAERLAAHAVPVELKQFDGLAHGFTIFANLIDTASDALDTIAAAIKSRCMGSKAHAGSNAVPIDAPAIGARRSP